MAGRETMDRLFSGESVNGCPFVAPYIMLSNADHWVEYTGRPIYEFYQWQWQNPEEHVKLYELFQEKTPFDWMQPYFIPNAKTRSEMEIQFLGGKPYMHNKRTGSLEPVPSNIHEAGSGGAPNETRRIARIADIKGALPITTAEQSLRDGDLDMLTAFAKRYQRDHFIVTGGVVNTFYSCSYHIGMTNLYELLIDEPEFILELEKRILEQNIETIRSFAMAGGDAIYIDDATATSDMISVDFYEKFSLPFLDAQVKEIQRLGKKAILIYFGGVDDRLDQILSTNPDGLMIEARMKNFVNDVEQAAIKAKGRCVVFGNLNPVDVENRSTDWLDREMRAQAAKAAPHSPFVASTGSPLTPGTSIERMREVIDLAHQIQITNNGGTDNAAI